MLSKQEPHLVCRQHDNFIISRKFNFHKISYRYEVTKQTEPRAWMTKNSEFNLWHIQDTFPLCGV